MTSNILGRGALVRTWLACVCLTFAPAFAGDIEDGKAKLDEGNVEEAVACFERALEADPESIDARIGLARAMILWNDMEEATTYLEPVIAAHPDHAEANLYLGIVLFYKARVAADAGKVAGYVAALFNDARGALERSIKSDPSAIEPYQYLGLVAYWQQDFPGAIEALERGLEVDPEDAFSHFQLGEIHRVQENYEDAVAAYEAAIELEPKYAEAMRNAGLSLEFLERTEEAEAMYRKAIETAPTYLEAYRDIWRLYGADATSARKGIAAMTKLRSELPDTYYVHWYLGHFYAAANQRDKAIDSFEKVLKINPETTAVYLEVANVLEQDGQLDKAIDHLERGYAKEKKANPDLVIRESPFFQKLLLISTQLGAERDFKKAEKLLLALAKDAPENGYVWSNLGLVYRDWNKYKKALDAYAKAADILSFDAQVLNDYAVVLDYHFNRTEEAFALYKKAVEISENVDALENLARFYLRAGQYEEALRMAERGLRLEPNRMQLRDYKQQAERRTSG